MVREQLAVCTDVMSDGGMVHAIEMHQTANTETFWFSYVIFYLLPSYIHYNILFQIVVGM